MSAPSPNSYQAALDWKGPKSGEIASPNSLQQKRGFAAIVLIALLGFSVAGLSAGTASAAPTTSVVNQWQATSGTVSQNNARNSAQEYLSISAFSRSGLIHQLEYEGFSTPDATYGVDSLNVDWNDQAAKSAKEYLSISSFSRSGLIQQLEYEGFTPQQAEFGVGTTGL